MDGWSIIAVAFLPLAGMLLFIMLASDLARSIRRRLLFSRKEKCVMCRQVFDKRGLESWSIRGERIPVCQDCHPYFKQRFPEKRRTVSTPEAAAGVATRSTAAVQGSHSCPR